VKPRVILSATKPAARRVSTPYVSTCDDCLFLGIQRHCVDGIPISGSTAPTRVDLAGLPVQRMARLEQGHILSGVALLRADVADAAAVLDVVPMHEGRRPLACTVQVGKALGREFRPVLT